MTARAFVNPGAKDASNAAPVKVQGYPFDWSFKHLIFSRPSSPEMARRLERNPRYRMQQAWRARQSQTAAVEQYMRSLDAIAQQLARASTNSSKGGKTKPPRLTGDWSVNLGSGANVGAGRYPAKFSFNPNATPSCTSDFVVFNTSVTGSATQASVVAFNQLYATTCGTAPSVYWAYNTGGLVNNSVVLSADGTQVAFVQSGTPASLVILKWKAGQGTSASAPMSSNGSTFVSTTSASSYVSCKATSSACQLTLTFLSSTLSNDSVSSPFYDYTNDILYVGDDGGALHKFTGVFNGTAAEVGSGAAWQTVQNNKKLTSPVVDYGASTPTIYIGEYKSGYIDYLTTAGTNPTRSGQIGFNTTEDIADAPVVDSTAGKAYVTVSNDNVGTTPNTGLFTFVRNFTSGSKGTEAMIGTSTTSAIPVFNGDFDNVYYNSPNGTGNLYVCGNAGGNPILYQVAVTATGFGTITAGPTVASAKNICSPVTEIYNPNATGGPFDWIFLSVQASGSLSNCAGGGCVMDFIVTEWQPSTAYSLNQEVLDTNLNVQKVTTAGTSNSSQPSWNSSSGGKTSDGTVAWTNQGSMSTNAASRAESGGTSGIIIDNVSSTTGASQVYFSTLTSSTCGTGGSGGCAVQASQSGLQ